MRLVAALLAVGCGGTPPPPPPKPATGQGDLAALERCAAAAERDEEMSIDAFVEACGDGAGGATAYDRLARAAALMRERRVAAIAATREDLVERVDLALGGRMFLLPLDAGAAGWDLARATSVRPATQLAYTVATADEVHRQRRSYARLSPPDDPPIAELPVAASDVVAYPILLVADRALPALRVLDIALVDRAASAELAVVGPDGVVGVHAVALSSAEGARRLALPDGATVADLVAALDAAAQAGATAATVAP
ncbi:MAG TPA: hypothetical protein VMZ28_30430 [Kofleriaceae bacterium]|nr:hypothetical protein [Kofleriaceae bacterium]